MPEGSIDFAAVVLAGGRSSRMGLDKALLPFENARLIDRQVQVLRALPAGEVLVSGRAGVDYAVGETRVVVDALVDGGPLAGLTAAWQATTASHLLVLAVDLPKMTADFLRRLWERCGPETGCVPRTRAGWEPLAAVYPRRGCERALRQLAAGRRRMSDYVEAGVAAGELVAWPVPAADEWRFENWNTPDDLRAGNGIP